MCRSSRPGNASGEPAAQRPRPTFWHPQVGKDEVSQADTRLGANPCLAIVSTLWVPKTCPHHATWAYSWISHRVDRAVRPVRWPLERATPQFPAVALGRASDVADARCSAPHSPTAPPRPAIAVGVSARSLPSRSLRRWWPATLGDRAGQIPTSYGDHVHWRRLGGSPRRAGGGGAGGQGESGRASGRERG